MGTAAFKLHNKHLPFPSSFSSISYIPSESLQRNLVIKISFAAVLYTAELARIFFLYKMPD